MTNSFKYYARAIALDPTEPIYYQNFATTVYLFRHDATNFYKSPAGGVRQSDGPLPQGAGIGSDNFCWRQIRAEHYGFKPPRLENARPTKAEQIATKRWLMADALKLARDEVGARLC